MEGNITNIIFLISASVVISCYLYVIFLALNGWNKIKQSNTENKNISVKLSLLIPFRNEEKNLLSLIESLKKQSVKPFEIIFIDDHSDDNGKFIISEESKLAENIKLICCDENSHGKKAALKAGLGKAKGDWIIQTDADCIVPEKWIESFLNTIEANPDCIFISGPVRYIQGRSFFSWFFELDFLSLVFSGAGYIGAGRPVFCNGANMAYKREEALKLNDPYYRSVPSGDDVFLMQQLYKKNKNGVIFLKNKNAIVETESPGTIAAFLNQRIRWGSKTRNHKSGFAIFIALVVFISNLAMPVLFIPALLGYSELIYPVVFSALKIITDTTLLTIAAVHFKRESLIPMIIPASILYPFYLIFTASASVFIKTNWKK